MVSLSRKQTNSPVTMMMRSRSRSQYKSTCFTSTKVLALLVVRVSAMMSSGDVTWRKRALVDGSVPILCGGNWVFAVFHCSFFLIRKKISHVR